MRTSSQFSLLPRTVARYYFSKKSIGPQKSIAKRLHSTMAKASFSANSDEETLNKALATLLSTESSDGKWSLTAQGNGLERSFKFKTFKKTWEFMNTVAAECQVQKHHPEWSNVYNTTFIRWTTHSPPGLSVKDISMAQFCDQQSAAVGEVESSTANPGVGKELADRVAMEGGDCCVPKSKKKEVL